LRGSRLASQTSFAFFSTAEPLEVFMRTLQGTTS
jgi:hypothetical protein